MLGRRPVTQADVATAAGVSTASVSRVLNNPELVKPEVKRRVEQAIVRLNYIPHEGARALATRRTRFLGAIIPTLNSAIFANGINAFECAARARGYTIVLSVSNYDLNEERGLVRKMIERGVDGLLLVGNDHLAESFTDLVNAGVRHVCAWTYADDAKAPNVGFSNAAAIAELVDYLVALGHRRFGMLAGITVHNDRARERVIGARARLERHKLSLPQSSVIEIPYSVRQAREALPRLLEKDVSAIICGNDVIAFGALLEAQKRGIKVPQELSITGFDNLDLSDELDPPITTVDVPATAMGRLAAGALIDALETDGAVNGQVLETTLLIRGTTAPPCSHRDSVKYRIND